MLGCIVVGLGIGIVTGPTTGLFGLIKGTKAIIHVRLPWGRGLLRHRSMSLLTGRRPIYFLTIGKGVRRRMAIFTIIGRLHGAEAVPVGLCRIFSVLSSRVGLIACWRHFLNIVLRPALPHGWLVHRPGGKSPGAFHHFIGWSIALLWRFIFTKYQITQEDGHDDIQRPGSKQFHCVE